MLQPQGFTAMCVIPLRTVLPISHTRFETAAVISRSRKMVIMSCHREAGERIPSHRTPGCVDPQN